jgi:hypothetical protein
MELILARERKQGYIETIQNQKKKRKRGRTFTEELRAEEGLGVLFFSPSKIDRAKELQAAEDEAKEHKAQSKLVKAHDRAIQKVQKNTEPRQRLEDRTARAAAKKARETLMQAQRQEQKEIKEAQKQLAKASRSLNDRPRKEIKTQKESTRSMVVFTELKPQQALSCVTSRSGHAIKRPAQFDEI